jgi:hypothetical protein
MAGRVPIFLERQSTEATEEAQEHLPVDERRYTPEQMPALDVEDHADLLPDWICIHGSLLSISVEHHGAFRLRYQMRSLRVRVGGPQDLVENAADTGPTLAVAEHQDGLAGHVMHQRGQSFPVLHLGILWVKIGISIDLPK